MKEIANRQTGLHWEGINRSATRVRESTEWDVGSSLQCVVSVCARGTGVRAAQLQSRVSRRCNEEANIRLAGRHHVGVLHRLQSALRSRPSPPYPP